MNLDACPESLFSVFESHFSKMLQNRYLVKLPMQSPRCRVGMDFLQRQKEVAKVFELMQAHPAKALSIGRGLLEYRSPPV